MIGAALIFSFNGEPPSEVMVNEFQATLDDGSTMIFDFLDISGKLKGKEIEFRLTNFYSLSNEDEVDRESFEKIERIADFTNFCLSTNKEIKLESVEFNLFVPEVPERLFKLSDDLVAKLNSLI